MIKQIKYNFQTHNNYTLGTLRSKRLHEFYEINNCTTFVETGTYKGDGVQWALEQSFNKIYSVEIHDGLFKESTDRFANNPNVKISKADTVNFLKIVIPTIKEKTLIYLDAHISGLDSSHHPDHPVPLEKESKIITDLFYNFSELIVVVDDARLWDDQLIHNIDNIFTKKNMVMSYIDDSYVFCEEKHIKNK